MANLNDLIKSLKASKEAAGRIPRALDNAVAASASKVPSGVSVMVSKTANGSSVKYSSSVLTKQQMKLVANTSRTRIESAVRDEAQSLMKGVMQ